jgi:hypothetical protein
LTACCCRAEQTVTPFFDNLPRPPDVGGHGDNLMESKMNRIGFLGLMAAVAFSAACSDSTTPSAPQARLRVVHASPDAPNVDVYVDGTKVLTSVPFLANSGYLSVPAGAHNVKVNATGTQTTVIDVTSTLAANTDYTAIATDVVAKISPLLLTDDNTAPVAGKVKVRLVHAAPGAGTVDIYVTGPNDNISTIAPTLSGVPFQGVSPYLEVPAGSYRVRVTLPGTKTVAIDSGTLDLMAGQIRTGVAVDNTGGGAPFSAIVLADRN